MAVPSGNSHLKNTTGGAFVSQNQGGTILGNETLGDVITKALLLKDATDDFPTSPLPVDTGNMYGAQKSLTGGTFAYFEAGKYVIRSISDTLSGVASNEVLIPGSDTGKRIAIHQLLHQTGAKLLAKWRANEFAWTGRLDDGTPLLSRTNWKNAAGNAVGLPVAANEDPHRPETGGTGQKSDGAANPTRAIPGELVLKVDFVDTSVATGGDFFDYKPITGM